MLIRSRWCFFLLGGVVIIWKEELEIVNEFVLVVIILYLKEVMGMFFVIVLMDWSRKEGFVIVDFVFNCSG